jgi:hypothetical protein
MTTQPEPEKCNCSPPNELSQFGKSVKHASHYKDCPMYQEPNEQQKANARKMMGLS